ncbi:MAG: hypothetical protein ACK5IM_10265, partial [Demequina sp.]|uniref:hypothetical protein n=1 Tax=Demequina sp. TaxID=2050685 RepID=UPI003A88385B
DRGAVQEVQPVTEAETTAVREERANFTASPPSAAVARDLVASAGVPLAEAGAGLALAQTCEAEIESAVDPLVVPVEPEMPPLPGEVTLTALESGAPVVMDGEYSADAWYANSVYQWMFVRDGEVVANVSASLAIEDVAGDEVDGVGAGTRAAWYSGVDNGCSDISQLAPGNYGLVMVAQKGVPPVAMDQYGVEEDGTFSTWIDAGEVTIVE